jgi:hypothetical protein
MHKKWANCIVLGFGGLGLAGCAAGVDDEPPAVAATSAAASSIEPVSVDEAAGENIGTPVAATSAAASSSNEIGSVDQAGDETGGENIGTSMEALTNGQRVAICQASALVAGALGCAGVTASCAASEVLTVGSVTIPCVLLVAFACAAHVGGTSVIATYCPEYVNR